MIGGIAVAATSFRRAVRVVAAEPALADDAFRSKAAGKICGHQDGKTPETIADGLRTLLGPNTFPLVRDLVDDVILVSEDDIASATKLVWERMKIAIEPSAGVGVAAVLSNAFRQRHSECRRVGVVLCGGNCDIGKLMPVLVAAPALPSGCLSAT